MKNIIKLLRFLEEMDEKRFNKIYIATLIIGILFGLGFFINAIAHLLGK